MTRKRKGSVKRTSAWIFELEFHRIILDEAHKIRNQETKFFKSCSAILADRRLAITGTPFVNKTDDIHSLLCFLNANHPADNPLLPKKQFLEFVAAPIAENKLVGLSRIRTQMQHISLRRTKNLVDLKLPAKRVHIVSVPFAASGFHREVHRVLYKTARECFLNLLSMDKRDMYRHFLEFFVLVLRVRQSCDHGALVPNDAFERATKALELIEEAEVDIEGIRMDEDEAKKLLLQLLAVLKPPTGELPEECGICLEGFDESTAVALRGCCHVFCLQCMNTCLQTSPQLRKCPLCRHPFKKNDRITVAQCKKVILAKNKKEKISETETAEKENEKNEESPKITALLEKIQEMGADEKGIIFSQWTSFLNTIQKSLEDRGHTCCRIDGSISAEGRLEAMRKLEFEGGARFCLISLMAGGVGITLTRANVCFMMDPW
jgi:DNA repair protein RAD5